MANCYLCFFEPVMFLTISLPSVRPIVVNIGTAIFVTALQNPPFDDFFFGSAVALGAGFALASF